MLSRAGLWKIQVSSAMISGLRGKILAVTSEVLWHVDDSETSNYTTAIVK
jgi:hypothetical protein